MWCPTARVTQGPPPMLGMQVHDLGGHSAWRELQRVGAATRAPQQEKLSKDAGAA